MRSAKRRNVGGKYEIWQKKIAFVFGMDTSSNEDRNKKKISFFGYYWKY